MAVDLSVEWMGIKFPNPFLIASVPCTWSGGFTKAAKYGWAGGLHWQAEVMGRAGGSYHGYLPEAYSFIDKPPFWWSFQNSCGPNSPLDPDLLHPPEMVEAAIRASKSAGIFVGANLQEGPEPEAWIKVTEAAMRGGADFLEVNWSCPYHPKTGTEVASAADVRKEVLKAVREHTDLPVMVKLNASFTKDELAAMIRDAVECGANAISCSNTLRGLIGVNIDTGIPISCELNVDGQLHGMIGGVSGPGIKPMVLGAVAEIRMATDLHISAVGGITRWQDAVEFMLLGASTVQIGTAAMVYGYRMIKSLIRGLEEYMERKGYKRITEFVGKTTERYFYPEYIGPVMKQPRRMIVDEDKCIGCGLCMTACEAASCGSGALTIQDGVAKIDNELCKTCNTCKLVCPQGAISFEWSPQFTPEPVVKTSQRG